MDQMASDTGEVYVVFNSPQNFLALQMPLKSRNPDLKNASLRPCPKIVYPQALGADDLGIRCTTSGLDQIFLIQNLCTP